MGSDRKLDMEKTTKSRRSENRTKPRPGARHGCSLAGLRVCGATSNQGHNSPGGGRAHSPQDYCDGARTVSCPAKPCLCARMRTICDSGIGAHLVRLVELLVFWLPHFCCAQRLLAEKMITIVAYLHPWVVKFAFRGRSSGQEGRRKRTALPQMAARMHGGCSLQLLRLGS